jgi:poly-gamma-glutamate synthesis protein (capsule biosynthesis protein)
MGPTLARADVLFGNMGSVAIPDDYPRDQIDPAGLVSLLPGHEGAAALKRAGFDFMNMAANHVLDAGRVGMDHTRACLEGAGLVTGGIGYTQEEARQLRTVERNGLRFGFLCYGEDSNYTLGHTNPSYAYYELDTVIEDVRRCRSAVDVLVVSLHADLEFMPTPAVPRLRNSRAIAEAGATLLLQHHPHVPQGVEMVRGCLICYSLGNFVFDAHTSAYMRENGPHTAHSFVLLAGVGKDGVRSWERVPFEIPEPPEQRPTPMEGQTKDDALAYLHWLDGRLQDEEFVRTTWREKAAARLAQLIQELARRDPDNVVDEMVWRYCILAENRSWTEEILSMARERWEAQKQIEDPLHRPHYRYRNRGGT